jgi:hypothetical protein
MPLSAEKGIFVRGRAGAQRRHPVSACAAWPASTGVSPAGHTNAGAGTDLHALDRRWPLKRRALDG